MDQVVGKVTLYGRRPDEESFEITVEIGRPYKFRDDPEEWACPMTLAPLFKKLHDAHGADSFQALCLAIALVKMQLQDFRDKGGALSYEGTDDDFRLDAYGF